MDKRDFVTFAMVSVQHSVAHRRKIEESVKPNKERQQPRILEPLDASFHTRTEGTPVQWNVAEKWINGRHALGQKFQAKTGRIQETLHSRWKKKIAYPVAQIDEFVKHIFKEHNQEADHLTNLGTEVQRKVTIERERESEEHRELENSAWLLGW